MTRSFRATWMVAKPITPTLMEVNFASRLTAAHAAEPGTHDQRAGAPATIATRGWHGPRLSDAAHGLHRLLMLHHLLHHHPHHLAVAPHAAAHHARTHAGGTAHRSGPPAHHGHRGLHGAHVLL